MSEQMSMDFFSDTPPPMEEAEAKTYEALDNQLSDLMHELNGDSGDGKNQILKHCTLEISQHTREGQIAISCNPTQQTELLNTHVVGEAGDYKPLILDDGYLYLRRYWQYQQQLADQIKSRLDIEDIDEEWAKQHLDHYFPSNEDGTDTGETNWQKLAAERALHNQFLIVSGGPGTGKTTTITRILAILIEQNIQRGASSQTSPKNGDIIELSVSKNETASSLKKGGGGQDNTHFKVLLAAPTGKASIRMLDAISEAQKKLNLDDAVQSQMPTQASTIHKLLGFIPEKVSFKHNRNNPLDADVVLIDEASMIDIAMMSKLIEAVPRHAKLILIGDKDQLSSVETGSVFADMCEGLSGHPFIVTLQKNWRFSEDSNIGQLAKAANQGDSKTLLTLLRDEAKSDCKLLAPSIITGNLIPTELTSPWDNYFEVLNNPNASITEIFEAFNQYRILCALRRGLNGSTIMSSRIESALEKQGRIKAKNTFSQTQNWYHGRPVMITQNSYSKGLFNGDTGITLIRNEEVKVYFPDTEEGTFKSLASVRLPAFETTWAMTIHKSQGSEFNNVTLILPHEVMPLLTRQLIYTGITRAKENVSIVASEAVLNAGVKTEMVRATRISHKLFDAR